MNKEDTYKTKFQLVEPWIIQILNEIKKEIKNEHLLKNPSLLNKYFSKKAIQKLTSEELATAYMQEISEGNEEVGEWVSSRWVMKNGEVFQFFVEQLERINPQYDEIEEIEEPKGTSIMEQASMLYSPSVTYVFSIFNAVAFSEQTLERLREKALNETTKVEEKTKNENPEKSLEKLLSIHKEEISKLTDKYEKRLLGVQRKYTQDTEGLKKQIAGLHRKLHG